MRFPLCVPLSRPRITVSNCSIIVFSFFALDRGYKWLSGSFSAGDFKYVAEHTRRRKAEERKTEGDTEGGAYPCPQDGCTRLFQRLSSLDRHLSFEKCSTSLERLSLLDLAKTEYASLLREGMATMPTLYLASPFTTAVNVTQEGWALKDVKKAYRFNETQKSYLEAKFNLGQATGRKLDPNVVAKEMRRALGPDGKRLFKATEFLTVHQITSFFGRLAAKVRQQLVATDEDIFAAEEEVNFQQAREVILTSMNLEHPIVYDQYDICAMVCNDTLKNLKMGLLQMLCEKLNLEVSVGDRRKKSSYIQALTGLVDGCSCGRSGSDY